MKKIGVIGHFGHGLNLLNGQTVKTKIVFDELKNQLGDKDVVNVDTHGGFKTLLKLPILLVILLYRCKNIVIMPAQNGLRIIAPMLTFFNSFFQRKLHYVVVGGWLPVFLSNRPRFSKLLKRNFYLYVETNGIASSLKSKGFVNVFVMPNFKKLQKIDDSYNTSFPPFKFCTFSRVMREKGIEDAINAIKLINEECEMFTCSLDIYGQVESGQEKWFANLQKEFPENVHYCGKVPFEESVVVLKNYYALLFPTYYEGEGFAGTILDAFSSGVPVIASDWHYNEEILSEGIDGFLFKTRDVFSLCSQMKRAMQLKNGWIKFRKNCIQRSNDFLPHKVICVLADNLV